MKNNSLPTRSENFSEWYTQVVQKAELADYGPVKGTMIIRPYGYALWENTQKFMDEKIKDHGVDNGYFPLFIPESFLNKEKEHVEGFSPELAVISYAGGEELAEKIVVRPTSETIMYNSYSKWIQSWRDLPLNINQWNNVVRWEKRTHLFLRTSEFLWQEGHTAHSSHEESLDMVYWAMENLYNSTYTDLFAVPGIIGRKSESEKFAGAVMTLTLEALMPDGKALQACTSHDLGQNFSKAFDISFQDKDGENKFAWQTSWGLSTRSIGGLIMVHGDDRGLKLPPKIAPIQVIIIPIRPDDQIYAFCSLIAKDLKEHGIRVSIDDSTEDTLKARINRWELKGVPLRIEIGKKEFESGQLTIARRDIDEKYSVETNSLVSQIHSDINSIQQNMFNKAQEFLDSNTHTVDSYDDFKNIMSDSKGFLKAFWCGDLICENKIKEETKASTRCLPLDAVEEKGQCIYCHKESKYRWIFAQAY